MALKVFEIKEETPYKEFTLYPAQGEDRPLIVFNTVMGDGEELWQALRALDAPDCSRSMRCTAATASRGWPACPVRCGSRSSGNTCFGMS